MGALGVRGEASPAGTQSLPRVVAKKTLRRVASNEVAHGTGMWRVCCRRPLVYVAQLSHQRGLCVLLKDYRIVCSLEAKNR